MEKAQRKKEERLKRRLMQEKKRRNMRVIVWSLAAVFVALIVILIAIKPKSDSAIDVSSVTGPLLGKSDAPVKITEFGDFKCPVCADFYRNVMSKIKPEYIDTGKASITFMNWPIISPESDSTTAALAGLAVYHQNNEQFWKFYDAVYANQKNEKITWATVDFLTDLAKRQGLKIDYDKFKQDIENATYRDELNAQIRIAEKNGFTGTPTVLINGRKLDDKTALIYENLKAEIDKALREAGE